MIRYLKTKSLGLQDCQTSESFFKSLNRFHFILEGEPLPRGGHQQKSYIITRKTSESFQCRLSRVYTTIKSAYHTDDQSKRNHQNLFMSPKTGFSSQRLLICKWHFHTMRQNRFLRVGSAWSVGLINWACEDIIITLRSKRLHRIFLLQHSLDLTSFWWPKWRNQILLRMA